MTTEHLIVYKKDDEDAESIVMPYTTTCFPHGKGTVNGFSFHNRMAERLQGSYERMINNFETGNISEHMPTWREMEPRSYYLIPRRFIQGGEV